jgi:hypothetical protein
MSGRLIITTKKTYCPWSQHNVERVLRDERLERERIEKEAKSEKDAAAARRRELHTDKNCHTDESEATVQRHVNLFPEAEEAELRQAQGQNTVTVGSKKENGVLPVPLGGEEAANRKTGRVPFYMQSSRDALDSNAADTQNYVDRVLGRKVEGDAITGQIMRDQAVHREKSRKFKNDPMMRFYQSGECRETAECTKGLVQSKSQSNDETGKHSNYLEIDADRDGKHASKRHKSSKKSRRKEKRHRSSGNASSDSSASSSDASYKRHSKKKHKRKHRDRRHSNRHSGHASATSHAADETLDSLRKKRLEREARENARSQTVLGRNVDNNPVLFGDRDRGYQDQWNPMLSRK